MGALTILKETGEVVQIPFDLHLTRDKIFRETIHFVKPEPNQCKNPVSPRPDNQPTIIFTLSEQQFPKSKDQPLANIFRLITTDDCINAFWDLCPSNY